MNAGVKFLLLWQHTLVLQRKTYFRLTQPSSIFITIHYLKFASPPSSSFAISLSLFNKIVHFSSTASCQGIYINKCRESINSSSCNKTSKFMYRSFFILHSVSVGYFPVWIHKKVSARTVTENNKFVILSKQLVDDTPETALLSLSILLLPLTYLKIDASAKSIFNFCRSRDYRVCAYALCQFKWLAVTRSDYV